jgi:hypothetical protein
MDLTKIQEPLILDNVLHPKDNLKILDYLFSHGKFSIGVDILKPKIGLAIALLEEMQHSGFRCVTKSDEGNEDLFSNILNIYGFMIINQLSKTLNFEYEKITRIAYNYYCRNQFSTEHKDSDKENDISVVYNLHTTDGGTKILDKEYQDVASQVKIFKSNWLHSSTPTQKDKGRVCLNIKFE